VAGFQVTTSGRFWVIAKVHVWAPAGFVVGADGRGLKKDMGKIKHDNLRKLIPLRAGRRFNLRMGRGGSERIF
jgi:hypothetical protein